MVKNAVPFSYSTSSKPSSSPIGERVPSPRQSASICCFIFAIAPPDEKSRVEFHAVRDGLLVEYHFYHRTAYHQGQGNKDIYQKMDRGVKLKAYAAWGAVCFFWGTTYLAIKI